MAAQEPRLSRLSYHHQADMKRLRGPDSTRCVDISWTTITFGEKQFKPDPLLPYPKRGLARRYTRNANILRYGFHLIAPSSVVDNHLGGDDCLFARLEGLR
jgi:hypothetical protein